MNTTILTENSHPQATGGHRTGSSLNMPPKSWKDYVPRYVSLYYVDYNENLDSREDLQERCIRQNSLHISFGSWETCFSVASFLTNCLLWLISIRS